MIHRFPKTFRGRPGSIAVALSLVMSLSGCVTDPSQSRHAQWGRPDSGLEFTDGVDRPPTARTLYAMARIMIGRGKDAEAKFVLDRIINEHHRFVPAYGDLAELHVRNSRLDDAVEVLSKGLKIEPENAQLLNNMGMCVVLMKDYEKAITYFAQAVEVVPDDARYVGNMAMALGMAGRYDESLAHYKKVVRPGDAYYNLGVLCEARDDPENAAKAFRQSRIIEEESSRRRAHRVYAPHRNEQRHVP